jgi:hypothetical protein
MQEGNEQAMKLSANPNQECEQAGEPEVRSDAPPAKNFVNRTADVLEELYRLLNEYAPPWYEQRYQRRAEDTLRELGRL